jgi:hypothetical protein
MKQGRTKDELVRNFSQASAPPNDFAGAAEGGARAFSTFPVTEIGDTMEHPPFPDRSTEYRAPVSNLPMTVSAEESRRHNCEWQGQQPWDAESEAAPILAGTRSGTPSATPTSPVIVPMKQGDVSAGKGLSEGVGGVLKGAGEAVYAAGHALKRVAEVGEGSDSMHDPDGARVKDSSIEDAFSRLRRMGGGY